MNDNFKNVANLSKSTFAYILFLPIKVMYEIPFSKISSKDFVFRFLVPKYCPSCDVPHCVKPVKTKHGAGGDLFVRWQSTWYSTQILPPSSSLRMTCGKFSWGSQLLCCCFFSAQSADVLRSYFAKSTPLSSYEAEKKSQA